MFNYFTLSGCVHSLRWKVWTLHLARKGIVKSALKLLHSMLAGNQESGVGVQGASKEERVKVYAVADKLLADNGLPKTTKVTSVMEGFETAIFKQFFVSWREAENTGPSWTGFGRQYSCNAAIAEWNIDDLHLEARKRIAKSAGAAIG